MTGIEIMFYVWVAAIVMFAATAARQKYLSYQIERWAEDAKREPYPEEIVWRNNMERDIAFWSVASLAAVITFLTPILVTGFYMALHDGLGVYTTTSTNIATALFTLIASAYASNRCIRVASMYPIDAVERLVVLVFGVIAGFMPFIHALLTEGGMGFFAFYWAVAYMVGLSVGFAFIPKSHPSTA